jgi:hypothetical protein
MAIDILRANDSNEIKHYTAITRMPTASVSGWFANDNAVTNLPEYADISGKYEDRFDDVSYYVT